MKTKMFVFFIFSVFLFSCNKDKPVSIEDLTLQVSENKNFLDYSVQIVLLGVETELVTDYHNLEDTEIGDLINSSEEEIFSFFKGNNIDLIGLVDKLTIFKSKLYEEIPELSELDPIQKEILFSNALVLAFDAFRKDNEEFLSYGSEIRTRAAAAANKGLIELIFSCEGIYGISNFSAISLGSSLVGEQLDLINGVVYDQHDIYVCENEFFCAQKYRNCAGLAAIEFAQVLLTDCASDIISNLLSADEDLIDLLNPGPSGFLPKIKVGVAIGVSALQGLACWKIAKTEFELSCISCALDLQECCQG